MRPTALPLLLALNAAACGPSKTEQRHQRELEATVKAGREKTNETLRDLRRGRFDLEYYDEIENGMDCEQVDARLGKSGREVSTSTVGKVTTLVRRWGDDTGSITVTFTDGKVTSKSREEAR